MGGGKFYGKDGADLARKRRGEPVPNDRFTRVDALAALAVRLTRFLQL
jgi:hypothetical protein